MEKNIEFKYHIQFIYVHLRKQNRRLQCSYLSLRKTYDDWVEQVICNTLRSFQFSIPKNEGHQLHDLHVVRGFMAIPLIQLSLAPSGRGNGSSRTTSCRKYLIYPVEGPDSLKTVTFRAMRGACTRNYDLWQLQEKPPHQRNPWEYSSRPWRTQNVGQNHPLVTFEGNLHIYKSINLLEFRARAFVSIKGWEIINCWKPRNGWLKFVDKVGLNGVISAL